MLRVGQSNFFLKAGSGYAVKPHGQGDRSWRGSSLWQGRSIASLIFHNLTARNIIDVGAYMRTCMNAWCAYIHACIARSHVNVSWSGQRASRAFFLTEPSGSVQDGSHTARFPVRISPRPAALRPAALGLESRA